MNAKVNVNVKNFIHGMKLHSMLKKRVVVKPAVSKILLAANVQEHYNRARHNHRWVEVINRAAIIVI